MRTAPASTSRGPDLEPGQEGAGQAGPAGGRGTPRGWPGCRPPTITEASAASASSSATSSAVAVVSEPAAAGRRAARVVRLRDRAAAGLDDQDHVAGPADGLRPTAGSARRGRPPRRPARRPAASRASAPASTPISTGRCSRRNGASACAGRQLVRRRRRPRRGDRPSRCAARAARPVQQQVLLAAEELAAVVGEASPAGRPARRAASISAATAASSRARPAATCRVARRSTAPSCDPDGGAVLDRAPAPRRRSVDQHDAGLGQDLGAEVRVAAGDQRRGVDDRDDAGVDQRLGGAAVEVEVVEDGDVAGAQPRQQGRDPSVDPGGPGDAGQGSGAAGGGTGG